MVVDVGIINIITHRVILFVLLVLIDCPLCRLRKTSTGTVRPNANLQQGAGNLANVVSDHELFRGAGLAFLHCMSRPEHTLSETESKMRRSIVRGVCIVLHCARFIYQSEPMYNNCALVGGIICLADVFLLGADSQTDNPTRFVKLCQVCTADRLVKSKDHILGFFFFQLKGSLLAAGFSICYGGLLAKLVRTYLLSTKKTIVCAFQFYDKYPDDVCSRIVFGQHVNCLLLLEVYS
jgi:hypothetical protein